MSLALAPLPVLPAKPFAVWFHTARRPAQVTGVQRVVHEMARRATVRIMQPEGAVIECLEGCVWVTLDGDTRDVVIDAGQHFLVDRNDRALVHALDAARVRIVTGA